MGSYLYLFPFQTDLNPFVSGYFAQHHVDTLTPNVSAVKFLQTMFPGKTEQEYRAHLGAFGITGLTGMQTIATLSGGQKSRVAFAALSMQNPHVLLLDEVSPGSSQRIVLTVIERIPAD